MDGGAPDPDEGVVGAIAAAEASPDERNRQRAILNLLREQHPSYRQRSASDVAQMRGTILAAFARTRLPAEALPLVLGELESGHEPAAVAGAARALRSAERSSTFAPVLLAALRNLRGRDELVSFGDGATEAVSAEAEVLATLAWLGALDREKREAFLSLYEESGRTGPKARREAWSKVLSGIGSSSWWDDCCAPEVEQNGSGLVAFEGRDPAELREVLLEDHTGRTESASAMLAGMPSVVAFFYTRCENPNKCSLTVSKLARLRMRAAERGLYGFRVVGVTYDPLFDTVVRLSEFARARGMALDDDNLVVRSIAGTEVINAHFGLGVNFVGSLVNRHRIEVFLLDQTGRVTQSFVHRQWREDDVLDQLAQMMGVEAPRTAPSPTPGPTLPLQRKLTQVAAQALPALAVAVFPKCPMCWAAYLSALGVMSAQQLPYSPWLLAGAGLAVLANLGASLKRAVVTRRYLPFGASFVGSALLALGYGTSASPILRLMGVVLISAGAVFNAVNPRAPVRLGP